MNGVALVALLVALAVCPSGYAGLAAGSRSEHDGWTVQVSVEPSDLGPIVVSVTQPRRVETHDPHVWLQHELVFENTSDRRITFADTWGWALLGPRGRPMLFVSADRRCAPWRIKPLRTVCILPLNFPVVRAHGRLSRTVRLRKGLPGATLLAAGTYVFRQPLRFRAGREVPAEGAGRSVTISLVYRVAAP